MESHVTSYTEYQVENTFHSTNRTISPVFGVNTNRNASVLTSSHDAVVIPFATAVL